MTSHLEIRSPGFARLVSESAPLERVASGFGFTEGPLWRGDHLLFSDIPNSRIVRWQPLPEGPQVRTFRVPSNLSNGLTLDLDGRLLSCEGALRRLTRTEIDGRITVLAERFEGKRVNSPNDVVVSTRGVVYFSDPFWANIFVNPYGRRVQPEDQELAFSGVFRVDPDGSLHVVADDFERPNGLAFSPDESVLYVDDTRRFHIRAFDVRADGSLANSRIFAEIRADEAGVPDGMKVDREGNVYCTGPGGVWVIAPSGEILGRIRPPEVPANVAWGGADWSTLYITARTSLYRIPVNVPGIPVPNRTR
ncbi:MAG: SMP-30/gluconolactonase/LRE family protein [Chloroflexi bacterium]|nr:SMP-30/gluconolactonase/LRE family protein [Chloroflexota bacterium]